MDEEIRKRFEYEEQFFGMSSRFFADCFKNLVRDEIDSKISMLVESLRGKIFEQSKNPDEFELALQKMKKDLTAEYQNSVDKLFPEIELKISSFIQIPQNVLLKEDLPVGIGINGDLTEIRDDIENLEGTFKSLLYLKQKILEELEEADSAIFLMKCVVSGEKLDFDILPVEDISALSKANNNLINNDA